MKEIEIYYHEIKSAKFIADDNLLSELDPIIEETRYEAKVITGFRNEKLVRELVERHGDGFLRIATDSLSLKIENV